MKIYIASKVKHAEKWRKLRKEGAKIISTWIDEAGEGQTYSYHVLACNCIEEIKEADALILYCEEGEMLKGALIEVGAALAFGKKVYAVGDCQSISRVFKEHPNWYIEDTVKHALLKAFTHLT
jgi:nucleoside 2-deoxyribosyltransferase